MQSCGGKLKNVMMQLIVWVTLLLYAAITGATCPPSYLAPMMVEMMYYSDVVVLGKALNHYVTSPNFAVFTVEFQVYCVYKGNAIPVVINITNAGNASDPCFNTQFTVGEEYLAFLYRQSDNRLTPAYPHYPEWYKQELYVMCDFAVSYPVGVRKESAGQRRCEGGIYNYDDDYEEESEDDYMPCITTFVPTSKSTTDSGTLTPADEMEIVHGDETADEERVHYQHHGRTGQVRKVIDYDNNGCTGLSLRSFPLLTLTVIATACLPLIRSHV